MKFFIFLCIIYFTYLENFILGKNEEREEEMKERKKERERNYKFVEKHLIRILKKESEKRRQGLQKKRSNFYVKNISLAFGENKKIILFYIIYTPSIASFHFFARLFFNTHSWCSEFEFIFNSTRDSIKKIENFQWHQV